MTITFFFSKKQERFKLQSPNPFGDQATAYRYRKWNLDDTEIIIRTEVDAAVKGSGNTPSFLAIRSLLEYNPTV